MIVRNDAGRQWLDRYGPWAIVTGASDGIGREIARELAQRGLNLILVARRAERLARIAAEIEQANSVETGSSRRILANPKMSSMCFLRARRLMLDFLWQVPGSEQQGISSQPASRMRSTCSM